MGFKKRLVMQCRKPRGMFGKWVAKGMNKAHSKMASWGLSHISINPEDIILDIGCGGGMNIYNFAPKINGGKVFGIDYSDVSVQMSKKLNKNFIESGVVEIQKASVSSLPFSENSFNLVTGFETYYFWPDLINDLKGILKVLRSGGKLLLVNEGFICDNEKLRKNYEKWSKLGNFPLHSPKEFQKYLEEAGFSEVIIHIEENERYMAAIGKK
ncbi:MAG: class I SAM-dependent methyltransferase [Candidatus Hermodarchaeota archaeon]